MKRPLILALATAVTLTATGCTAMNQQAMTCTVTAKESVTVNSGDRPHNQYRVYTNECGTLTIGDTIVVGRFNSADLYGTLQPGTTYAMETGGYRVGVFSMFPNIISATPINKENTP
jgi:hypothetical protein